MDDEDYYGASVNAWLFVVVVVVVVVRDEDCLEEEKNKVERTTKQKETGQTFSSLSLAKKEKCRILFSFSVDTCIERAMLLLHRWSIITLRRRRENSQCNVQT
jgi:hypothetical protein